jgi:hypothetical protein
MTFAGRREIRMSQTDDITHVESTDDGQYFRISYGSNGLQREAVFPASELLAVAVFAREVEQQECAEDIVIKPSVTDKQDGAT